MSPHQMCLLCMLCWCARACIQWSTSQYRSCHWRRVHCHHRRPRHWQGLAGWHKRGLQAQGITCSQHGVSSPLMAPWHESQELVKSLYTKVTFGWPDARPHVCVCVCVCVCHTASVTVRLKKIESLLLMVRWTGRPLGIWLQASVAVLSSRF